MVWVYPNTRAAKPVSSVFSISSADNGQERKFYTPILEARIGQIPAKVSMQNLETAVYVVENIIIASYHSYSFTTPYTTGDTPSNSPVVR